MFDSWLEQNNFHYTRFQDIASLAREKERQGLTISVGFPAINEETTIGEEVRCIREELMERHPLVDEIAVIDGGSVDRTAERAREAGADVYLSRDHLSHLGDMPGKGDNLWKSLYLLKGDIIVWVDADIKNIDPKFVYGLVGPLLYYPKLQFVKAYYERPLHRPGEDDEFGGGRVTEILVRPLFSAFFPELAQLYQPCSGECAGRRTLLESLPFAAGYGIETAMLIDIHARFGREVIAQVNLDKRVHRNQSTTALGKMGFEILHTFLNRLQSLDRARFDSALCSEYYKLICEPDVYKLEHAPVQLSQRPPINTIPEYRESRRPAL
jgi:glucosyl-3-phosphoglycerate synthase